MAKYKLGLELLIFFSIKEFQLFDYVKNGLQPFDKFGRPISPPDITSKQESLRTLDDELRVMPLARGVIEAQCRGTSYASEMQKCNVREKSLLKKSDDLKNEQENIENKQMYS